MGGWNRNLTTPVTESQATGHESRQPPRATRTATRDDQFGARITGHEPPERAVVGIACMKRRIEWLRIALKLSMVICSVCANPPDGLAASMQAPPAELLLSPAWRAQAAGRAGEDLQIPLSKVVHAGGPRDYEELSKYKWYAGRISRTMLVGEAGNRCSRIARSEAPPDRMVDHMNHSGWTIANAIYGTVPTETYNSRHDVLKRVSRVSNTVTDGQIRSLDRDRDSRRRSAVRRSD
jgi:hypothetical protein